MISIFVSLYTPYKILLALCFAVGFDCLQNYLRASEASEEKIEDVCLFVCFYFCIFKMKHNHIHKVTNISSFYIIIHF